MKPNYYKGSITLIEKHHRFCMKQESNAVHVKWHQQEVTWWAFYGYQNTWIDCICNFTTTNIAVTLQVNQFTSRDGWTI